MQCDAKVWEVGSDKDGFGLKGKVCASATALVFPPLRLDQPRTRRYSSALPPPPPRAYWALRLTCVCLDQAMELTGRTGGENRRGHSAAVHSVDFGGCSPARLVTDTTTAATGSKDGLCKVWNLAVRYKQNEDPKCTLSVEQHDKKPVSHVALSRGKVGKYLATWSPSAGLTFWSLPSGEKLSVIAPEDSGEVFRMEWFESDIDGHPDLLLAATPDGRSRAWLPHNP